MGLLQNIKKLFAEKTVRIKVGEEIGRSGTKIYGGYISQDFNTDFNNSRGVIIYDEMLRTDAMIRATFDAVKYPILATERSIVPPEDDPDDTKGMTAFVKQCIFEHLDFDGFLNEALNYLPFGFYYFEKIYGYKDGKIVYDKLASRVPTAHSKWEMDSDKTTPGVTQYLPASEYNGVPVTTATPEIPMEKLVLFVNNQQGDDYDGMSILRSAYKHWTYKDQLYKIDAIKSERGAGVLVVKPPVGHKEVDMDDAETMAKQFTLNEKSYIVAPNTDWQFEFLQVGNDGKGSTMAEQVSHHNRMIATNVLAQFIDLGSQSSGSYALSVDQTDFFTLSLRAKAKYIASVINKQMIEDLIDRNFGEQQNYPKFAFSDVGQIDYTEMAAALEKLVNTGLVVNNDKLKVWTHDQFRLPKLTEQDLEKEEETPEAKPEEGTATIPSSPEGDMIPEDKIIEPVEPEEEEIEAGCKPEDKVMAEKKSSNYKNSRPLTDCELRVAFAEQEEFWNVHDNKVRNILDKYTVQQKEALFKQIETAVNGGNLQAVRNITDTLATDLRKELLTEATAAIAFGKEQLAGEIKQLPPAPTPLEQEIVGLKVDTLIDERSVAVTQAVKSSIASSLTTGIGAVVAIDAAKGIFDSTVSSLNSHIAGTLIGDAYNTGRSISIGYFEGEIYALQRSEILDEKTCDMCLSLDGRIVEKDDPFASMSMVHDNCVHPDTIVNAPEASALMRIPYSGKMLRLKFGDGSSLAITPNHILLTDRGFRAVKFLTKGDNIIGTNFTKRESLCVNPDTDKCPASIANVFASLIENGSVPSTIMPISSEDFHGDGKFCKGNVDIISTDCLLLNNLNATLAEHITETFLDRTCGITPLFPSGCNLATVLLGLAATANSGMSIADIIKIFGDGSFAHHQAIRYGVVTNYNTRTAQAATDSVLIDFKMFGEFLKGMSSVVFSNNIIDIEEFEHNGFVYDLSTASTLYLANNIVSSNCRGEWVTILKTDAKLPEIKGIPSSIQAHFDTVGDVPQQNSAAPLKSPQITKDSRAQQAIDDGKI